MTTAFPIPHPNLDIVPKTERVDKVELGALRRVIDRLKRAACSDDYRRAGVRPDPYADPRLSRDLIRYF